MLAFRRLGRLLPASLALVAWVSACSLVVDFDRSKINASASGGKTHRGGTGGTGAAPAGGGTTGMEGGPGGMGMGGDAGPDAPKQACDVTTHAGCAADELCCDSASGQPACRKTSLDECESCGTACADDLASSCSGRTCQCEASSGRACSGKDAELHCVETGGESRCVECRDVTNCADVTGKSECVDGKCAACDPKNNAGCNGATPICDSTTKTCKKCSTSKNDCPGTLTCTSSGRCGGCDNSTDCVTPTTPICDPQSTECEACSGNAECQSELGLPYCVDGQRCSPCDPTSEAGCSDAAKPDCRQTSTGDFACQACTANANCENRASTPVCDTSSGHCVECADDADCKGDPKKPLCVGKACVACDTASIASVANDRCAAKPGGTFGACATTGAQKGACAACDPADSIGCSNSELCCEGSTGTPACVPTSASECTACGGACSSTLANGCSNRGCACGGGAACTGSGTEKFCVGSPGSCKECRNDADCASAGAPLCENGQCVACDAAANPDARCLAKSSGTPACSRTGALKGKCADCDPSGTGTGCGSGSQCDPDTAACVDCIDDTGCSGTKDKCNKATNKCVDCNATGGCPAATPVCDATVCRGCGSDAECAASPDATGPLCGSSGGCALDTACTDDSECTDGVHGQCVDVNPGDKRCRPCDPGNNDGCTVGETCSAQFQCGP